MTCPEPGFCEEALRPNATQPCNTQPCTQWVVGPWGQVSGLQGGAGTWMNEVQVVCLVPGSDLAKEQPGSRTPPGKPGEEDLG